VKEHDVTTPDLKTEPSWSPESWSRL